MSQNEFDCFFENNALKRLESNYQCVHWIDSACKGYTCK